MDTADQPAVRTSDSESAAPPAIEVRLLPPQQSDPVDLAAESTLDWANPIGECIEAAPSPRNNSAEQQFVVEPGEHSPLPWSKADPSNPEMVAMIRRADQRVRHGFQLAQRGALYSARSEYIAALQLVAQANDAQSESQYFSQALASGLTALKEASDFARQNPRKPETDVAAIVARHRTAILKGQPGPKLTPMAAAQRYYTFAGEQLATAASREMTGSMALVGLGKVALDPAGNRAAQPLDRTAQAMALYQAALMADAGNYRAANELGVLAAENGNLSRARDLFVTSLSLSKEGSVWRNLATVHLRLGEKQLAAQAECEALALERSGTARPDPRVQWLEPTAFAQTTPMTDSLLPAASAPNPAAPNGATAATTSEQKPVVTTAKSPLADWLRWSPRR
jgi:tetratricopeptide (TPR) repeat protein